MGRDGSIGCAVCASVVVVALIAMPGDTSASSLLARPPPIPKPGPLAPPRTPRQGGLPNDKTREAIPPDNPQTAEKIALGQKLFFDGRLSVDGTVACATCHDPQRAFTDGRPTSIGVLGRRGQRNSLTVLNALYNQAQFWDGRAKTLEDQAALPIANPVEMGQPDLEAAVASLAALPEYQQAFQAGFGRPPNGQDLVRALASYERGLTSFDSPFGRFLVTKKEPDIASFKTPGLRNVLVTGPYFHDGSHETLWDVLDHYNKGAGPQDPWLDQDIQPLGLQESELDDLVAFMASLTSDVYRAQGAQELARQRALSRTNRPFRDTRRAFSSRPATSQ